MEIVNKLSKLVIALFVIVGSMASVFSYGGGGASFIFFKTNENVKGGEFKIENFNVPNTAQNFSVDCESKEVMFEYLGKTQTRELRGECSFQNLNIQGQVPYFEVYTNDKKFGVMSKHYGVPVVITIDNHTYETVTNAIHFYYEEPEPQVEPKVPTNKVSLDTPNYNVEVGEEEPVQNPSNEIVDLSDDDNSQQNNVGAGGGGSSTPSEKPKVGWFGKFIGWILDGIFN